MHPKGGEAWSRRGVVQMQILNYVPVSRTTDIISNIRIIVHLEVVYV